MVHISAGTIKGALMTVLFGTVLFMMLPKVVPLAITAVSDFWTNLSGSSDTLGAGPASLAGTMNSITGWFWVLAAFGLVIGTVFGIFILTKGRRR